MFVGTALTSIPRYAKGRMAGFKGFDASRLSDNLEGHNNALYRGFHHNSATQAELSKPPYHKNLEDYGGLFMKRQGNRSLLFL